MQGALHRLVEFSLERPRTLIAFYVLVTVFMASSLPWVRVDTDPENMLSADEPVRITHEEVKREFTLHDAIVVGVVNESSPDGVFTPETLERVSFLTDEILKIDGVVPRDVISPTTTDDIAGEGGMLKIAPLMPRSIPDKATAERVRERALKNPVLRDLLVSADGKAITIAVPIEEKSQSYRISTEIREIIDSMEGVGDGEETYHIAGLPVAEDTFGVEMFKQMAVSAPLAGLIITLLMLYFFRSIGLVLTSMAVAMVTVVWAMGLLAWGGFTLHIMSSMIPIFLMPVAVLDSIHILSEFHEKYPVIKERKKTVLAVMDELMSPMLYTSITSAVGFASLMLTPIPPVRVFGGVVAFGILAALVLTLTLIPAVTMLFKESTLEGFGRKSSEGTHPLQEAAGDFAMRRSGYVLGVAALVLAVSVYGITLTRVNDNPVKWFESGHPIRVADTVLNRHMGGTYMAYLVLDGAKDNLMKDPAMARYIEGLQEYLTGMDVVGKTTSIVDVIKKINIELHDGDLSYGVVPESAAAIGQYLFLYEFSGNPDDLYHLVDPTYKKANIWVQLKSGDNQDMRRVVDGVSAFMEANPPPFETVVYWAGLTYLNVVWQDKMVSGMLRALGGGAIAVFFIMTVLFRSPLWGIISMLPLTVTIALIYGLVGFVGKDYDMPIAVLSSLTLGISVDFAIHLCQRARQIRKKTDDWEGAVRALYGEPVRAILRNMVVITMAFLPLLLSSLMPYRTVGFFFASIMAVSGVTTLLVLPSAMTLLKRPLGL